MIFLHLHYVLQLLYQCVICSGTHRPLWPAYGEYVYVPKQRWLHSLEVKLFQQLKKDFEFINA